jgi:hypothetical protein
VRSRLIVLTGPIAAGKNAVADELSRRLTGRGRTVVVADVDDVAAMVGPPGAADAGLWSAVHDAHGALVGQWLRSAADHVIVVGPVYSAEEQHALTRTVPDGVGTLWVIVEADVTVTLARAQADPTRVRSREPGFHRAAHRRYRELRPGIPADLAFDSGVLAAGEIAAVIADALG